MGHKVFLRECEGEFVCSLPGCGQAPGTAAHSSRDGAENLQVQLWASLALVAVMVKEICRCALASPGVGFPSLSSSSLSLLHPTPFPVELLNGAALQQLIRPEVPSRELLGTDLPVSSTDPLVLVGFSKPLS